MVLLGLSVTAALADEAWLSYGPGGGNIDEDTVALGLRLMDHWGFVLAGTTGGNSYGDDWPNPPYVCPSIECAPRLLIVRTDKKVREAGGLEVLYFQDLGPWLAVYAGGGVYSQETCRVGVSLITGDTFCIHEDNSDYFGAYTLGGRVAIRRLLVGGEYSYARGASISLGWRW